MSCAADNICTSRLTCDQSAEMAKWVCESNRPFAIVEDAGFRLLMKTGRPLYQIPSRYTIGRDIRKVFVFARKKIANLYKVREQKFTKNKYLLRYRNMMAR